MGFRQFWKDLWDPVISPLPMRRWYVYRQKPEYGQGWAAFQQQPNGAVDNYKRIGNSFFAQTARQAIAQAAKWLELQPTEGE